LLFNESIVIITIQRKKERRKMLKIHKNIVLDESKKPTAIQIPIKEFEHMEEVIENYGLAKLMNEANGDKRFSGKEAREYYQSLK